MSRKIHKKGRKIHKKGRKRITLENNKKYNCIHGNFILFCGDCMANAITQEIIKIKN